ncbi:LytR/AlgR family response regulator transcription factor [Hymenobacter terrenus]|uniref:LytR/AlgR family response regulator transcription factor n=1 Tax=Hymenobacter terrenus TaxID=1629124 RepID=UPI000697F209|nr:LytTR family DNA-binding domain-containing protein [Hymenobacter terrenus]
MINCLIVDDEPNAVKLLTAYVAQVPYLHLAHTCYDAGEALTWIQQRRVELIFLDINLPGMSGMELARTVAGDQKIIFTTAYSEFAVQSYETAAVDYLLKPITLGRFLQAVSKAADVLKTTATPLALSGALEPGGPALDHFFIKSGKQIVRVRYDAIRYVEGLKSYVMLVTATDKIIVYKRMQEMEALLPPIFRRVHLSYIINLDHIRSIEENHILLPPTRIPISSKYREAFLTAIKDRFI